MGRFEGEILKLVRKLFINKIFGACLKLQLSAVHKILVRGPQPAHSFSRTGLHSDLLQSDQSC